MKTVYQQADQKFTRSPQCQIRGLESESHGIATTRNNKLLASTATMSINLKSCQIGLERHLKVKANNKLLASTATMSINLKSCQIGLER